MNLLPTLLADGIFGTGTLAAAVLIAALPAAFASPLLYAIFNKAKKARTKGYSRRAIQSVGVWIIALVLTAAAAILALFGWYGDEDVNNYRMLAALVGAGAWSTAVIGIVISLQGLRETDRKFGKNRRRGRSYAVSGCSANGALLLLLLAGGGYYASRIMPRAGSSAAGGPSLEAAAIFAKAAAAAEEALLNAPEATGGLPIAPPTAPTATATGTAAQTGSPQLAVTAGGAARGRAWFGELFGARTADVVRDPGPEAVELPALNLRVRRPGGDWVRLDPARAGQNATVAYDEPKQSRRLLIVAQRPGVERGGDVKSLAEQLQKNLQSLVPSFQFTPTESQSYGGVPGLRFLGDGKQQGEPASVAAWVALYNGYAYQLLMVAAAHQTEAFAADARSLFQNFEPIDVAAVAHSTETVVATVDWKSPELGVIVPALGSAWNVWAESSQYFPTADYAARLDGQTGFVVYAVRTDDAPVDRLAAAVALLQAAGQPVEKATAQPPHKRTQAKIEGDEYEWTPADSRLGGYRIARVFTVPRAAYLLLGWCDTAGSPKDEALRKAIDAVTFTPPPPTDPTKLTPGRRAASARFYEAVGRYFLKQSQPATAEREYRTAQKYAPDDLGILAAIVDVCFQRGRYPEALTALNAKPAALIDRSDPLRIRKAEALAETGRRDEALKQYAAVFKDGYIDDAAFTAYVTQFEATNRIDEGLIAVSAYRQRRNTPSVTALEGRLLSRRGDNLAAAKLLERQMAATPSEPEPAYVLADVYRRLQRPLDALQVIDKLIGAGGASGTAYYWKGLAEYDLRRTRPAQLSFASAHRLDPTHIAAKQMLDLTTGLLGESQSYQHTTTIEAVPLPKSVSDAVPTSPMPDEYSRAPAFYLDRATAYSYRAGAEFRRTEYHTFRVLTEQGVDELNVLSIEYDPLSEEAYVNRLEVFDDKGRSTATGDATTYYTIDDASDGASLRRRRLEMPVPGLRTGYRVELVVTVKSLVGQPKFPFLAQIFGGRYPMRRQAVYLDADAQQLAWSGSLAESVRRDATGVWWQATDLPADVSESFAPPATETAPTLYVADKRSTWQQEVNDYIAEIAERRTVPPIVQQTALEMTAGLDSPEAKLLAVSAFVQREIAFRDAPFGPRNRVPQSPDETLNNRFGDSKDISLLLAMMLASVQIDTRIALVSTALPVQANLMTLDQFDHMVVFIGKGDSGRVIDACDKEADPRLYVPLRLAGRDCLVIDERSPRLVRLDRPTADSYRAVIDRKVAYDAAGKASVVETVTFHDYYAAAMRSRLRAVTPHQRPAHWQTLLREGGTVAVLNRWQVDRLNDFKQPLVVTCEYEIDRGVVPIGDGAKQEWIGNVPAPLESTQLAIGAEESRRYPLDFPFAVRITAATQITPPPGMPVPDTAGLDTQANDDLLQVKRTARADQGVLKFQTELVRTAGRYPPTRYEDYRRSVRRARTLTTPILRFIPAGP